MSHNPLSDEELMRRVQQGDKSSYHTLFDRHNRAIFGYLRRFSPIESVAEEMFQETWLKVYRSRHTWHPKQNFRPWLYQVATNTARDVARRSTRRIEEVPADREHENPRSHDATSTMDLEAAIEQLPDHLRTAFLLGPVQGFDHKEIAEMLEITPDNARARISRARAALREELRKRHD
jgi:RNA polymerase sigma factor (sigma-70 family)